MNPDIASLSSHSDKSLPRDIFTLDPLPEQGADSELAPSPGTSPRSNGIIFTGYFKYFSYDLKIDAYSSLRRTLQLKSSVMQ